jgi:hypothetical protein
MLPLKFNDTLKFSNFCAEILELDQNIMLVAIINERGRILDLKTKSCLLPFLDERDLEMLFMQRTLQTKMIKESDDKLGIFNFTLTKREKFYEFTTQFGEMMMLAIINSVLPLSEVASIMGKLGERNFVDFKLVSAISA